MPEKRHEHTPDEERAIREAALDETIEDSFPASDPPSTIPNPDNHDAVERPRAATEAAASDSVAHLLRRART